MAKKKKNKKLKLHPVTSFIILILATILLINLSFISYSPFHYFEITY